MRQCDGLDQCQPRDMDGIGIDRRLLRRQLVLGGRHQHLGGEGRIGFRARQHLADGGDVIVTGIAARLAGHFQHDLGSQDLTRFPAVEVVAILAHQHGAVVAAVRGLEHRRRGKALAQRQQRFFRHIDQHEALEGLRQFQHAAGGAWRVVAVQGQRQRFAGRRADQPDTHGNVHRLLVRLDRRRR